MWERTDDVPHPISSILLPLKVLNHLRHTSIREMKDASLELGLDQIDVVRDSVSSRLTRTRQAVKLRSKVVSSQLARTRQALQAWSKADTNSHGSASLHLACALGCKLLDSTEMLVERWLPFVGEASHENSPLPDNMHVLTVPRPLDAGPFLLQVTYFEFSSEGVRQSFRDMGSAVKQRFGEYKIMRDPHFAAAVLEQVLGRSTTEFILAIAGRIVARFSGYDSSDGVTLIDAGQVNMERSVAEVFPKQQPQIVAVEVVSHVNDTSRGFRVVVKNSFIDVVEDPSPSSNRCKPRSRSLDFSLGKSLDGSEPVELSFELRGPSQPVVEVETQERSASPEHPLQVVHQANPGTASMNLSTVLLRGLPSEYTTIALVELLNARGFGGRYTFVYAPVDFSTGIGIGYALVCLTTYDVAQELIATMQGFRDWSVLSNDVCSASWNEPHQGIDVLIERYRNSPVMHASVPDKYKPAIFRGCERVPFPSPSKTLRAPRVRQKRSKD